MTGALSKAGIAIMAGGAVATAGTYMLAERQQAGRNTFGSGLKENFPLTAIGRGYPVQEGPSLTFGLGQTVGGVAGIAAGTFFLVAGAKGSEIVGASAKLAGAHPMVGRVLRGALLAGGAAAGTLTFVIGVLGAMQGGMTVARHVVPGMAPQAQRA